MYLQVIHYVLRKMFKKYFNLCIHVILFILYLIPYFKDTWYLLIAHHKEIYNEKM